MTTLKGLNNLEGEDVNVLATGPSVSEGSTEVAWWQGSHGDEYTKRNADDDHQSIFREKMWIRIVRQITGKYLDQPSNLYPESILEIGAGSGNNLRAIRTFDTEIPIKAAEPNRHARAELLKHGFDAHDGTAAVPGCKADLVFTSGVLIHIPPEELMEACQGIYYAAKRYIVCIEYFSADPEEKPYRGRKLWTRDFGSFWMDNFNLNPVECGFEWKRITGLDNLTYWIFSKS